MIYIRNEEEINGQFKTENGTTYPSNWCDFASPEELEELGIIALQEIYPVLESNETYGGYIDDLVNKTRTYKVITLP